MPCAKLYQPPSSLPVKPDPPESVVAKPVPNNPRRLEVSWQNPSSWPDPESFPLKFFLRYRPLILDQWQHVSDVELVESGGSGESWWLGTSCTGNRWSGTKKKVYLLPRQPRPFSSPSLSLLPSLFLSVFLLTHILCTNSSAGSPRSVFSSTAPIYFPYICSI